MTPTLYLGTRKGLIPIRRDANGWRVAKGSFLGTHVPMLLSDRRDGTLYAALEHGHFGTKLHASTDGGVTWEQRTCPAYPPKPEGTADVMCPMRKIPIPWSLEKVWALEAGGVDEPGTLWCGTIPGGLFVSKDHGKSWTLNEPLWNMPQRAKWIGGGYDYPGIHSILVDPRNSRRLLVGVSCGGVWETRDAGQSWSCDSVGLCADYMPPDLSGDPGIQDAHRVSWCQAHPDGVWLQHHSGVYGSTDGGRNWQRFKNTDPSDFGFAVVTHPTDPKTAWFVPGVKDDSRFPKNNALCVMRTTNGGATFEALRKGLPQDNAFHLVYRHGLDVAPDGRTVAFASTTGSVWVSDNGGDDWQRVSADLPPVYCVRFG